MNESLETFLSQYREAYKAKAHDLLLAPVFKSTPTKIFYKDGLLKRADLPFKAPKKVTKINGGVYGHVVKFEDKKHFVVYPDPEKKLSPILQLHIAQSDKFKTVMALMSWWRVGGKKDDGSPKLRDLSTDRDEVIETYENRLKVINKVLSGQRRFYWSKEEGDGQRLLPIKKVIGLTVVFAPVYEGKT